MNKYSLEFLLSNELVETVKIEPQPKIEECIKNTITSYREEPAGNLKTRLSDSNGLP